MREVFKRPSGKVRAYKLPIMNEPVILMIMVPQGNLWPTRSATRPDTQNRAIPPKALPIPTQRYDLTISDISSADFLRTLAAIDEEQHRHAHRKTVGHLIEYK